MEMSIDVSPENMNIVVRTGTNYGILQPHHLTEARTAALENDIIPKWLIISPEWMGDIRTDDILGDSVITKETILRNAWVDNVQDRIEEFEEMLHEDSTGMIWGMEIVEDPDIRFAYIAGGDPLPDLDAVIKIEP